LPDLPEKVVEELEGAKGRQLPPDAGMLWSSERIRWLCLMEPFWESRKMNRMPFPC
jgi:hypothetical protein